MIRDISAHHGVINRPNDLKLTIILAEKRPDITWFEIDVSYIDGQFVVAHDAEQKDPNTLSTWLEECIPRGLYFWLDLKDSITSIMLPCMSTFPVQTFSTYMMDIIHQFDGMGVNIRHRVIIGSQFAHIHDQLMNDMLANVLPIVTDNPTCGFYILQKVASSMGLYSVFNRFTLWCMAKRIKARHEKLNVLAIDRSMFLEMEQCAHFTNSVAVGYQRIFVYSFIPGDTLPKFTLPITIQYDFKLDF